MIPLILKSQPHIIKGKKLDCKLAIPKDQIDNCLSLNKSTNNIRINPFSSDKNLKNSKNANKKNNININERKMFVGGLHPSLTTDSLKNYFSEFGKIEKVIIMKDKLTGRSRGFGFIIFSEKETIDKILFNANCHFIYGKWIECKRAEPKINNNNIRDNNLPKNFLINENDFKLNQTNINIDNRNKLFNYYHEDNLNEKNNNNNYNDEIIKSLNHNLYSQLLANDNNKKSLELKNNNFVNNLNENFFIKENLDNKKFQNYFNNYIKNPLWYNYCHYKLCDEKGEEVSKLNIYKKSFEKIKLFPEERDDKNSSSNSQESKSEKEKIENENASSKNNENIKVESLFGPDRTNRISKSSKSNDNYKPY